MKEDLKLFLQAMIAIPYIVIITILFILGCIINVVYVVGEMLYDKLKRV